MAKLKPVVIRQIDIDLACEQKGGVPMLLREHPLFSYHGRHSWPPLWTWVTGAENKHPSGELGVLKSVELSSIRPCNTCFLHIDYEGSSYMGCLIIDDACFCPQVAKLLQRYYNRPIAEIGSIDLTHTL